MQDVYLFGVDVAKDELVIASDALASATMTVNNSSLLIRQWLKTLPAGSAIAMESTGSYHQLLAKLALHAGMRVFVLNAKRVWYYAKGEGRRGKSDRVDAVVVLNYLRDNIDKLHAWCPGGPLQTEAETLLRRRQTVERHLTAIRMSMKDTPGLSSELKELEDKIDGLLQAINLRVHLLLSLEPETERKQALLETITGVGHQCSAALTCVLSRIPFKNSDAVVAYAGLDPRANDSGKKKGRRRLSKEGPAYLRKLLWLCGFSACHSKVFKPRYEALLAKGFKTTEAILILSRKILRIAWAVWRSGKPFDPALLKSVA
jgi:transposase